MLMYVVHAYTKWNIATTSFTLTNAEAVILAVCEAHEMCG